MKALALYALEVLACSGVLLAAYSILLERRVAFRWCRAYLLTATLLAAIIPLLRIPVWPGEVIELAPAIAAEPQTAAWTDETFEAVETAAPAVTPEALCLVFYLTGAGLLAGVMIAQAVRIRRLRRGAEISRNERFTLVRTRQQIASFSFFRSIYVWLQTPAEELPAIVAHEASHIAHRHSLERIAMECMKAALWWNPFAWIAARRLTEAEEFEADSDVLAGGYDVEHYMNVLFRQLFGYSPEIANGLRDSLTKKRFQMMTTPKSGRHTLLRLAGTLPVVTGLLCAFSFTTRAAEIRIPETEQTPAGTVRTEEPRHVQVAVTRDGKPLAGAVVVIAGTHRGTVTDKAGHAGIDAAPDATLVVTYVGCESQKIVIPPAETGPETIRVAMEMRVNELVPISITPGDKNNEPLCIVDGVEHPNIYDLDKETIARIDVLKNESAIASYGARGRNGVIIVTTKKAAAASDVRDDKDTFVNYQTMPSFQNGDLLSFRKWVQARVKYPAKAVKKSIQGRVVTSFVIAEDGSLTDVAIVQSPDELLSKEALRVLESSPKWKPGMTKGKPTPVKYTCPVDFRLDADGNVEFIDLTSKGASFRGGSPQDFRQWVQERIEYPQDALKEGVQGRVILSFVIRTDGTLTDIEVAKSPDPRLSAEAVRIVESSPADAWTPALKEGKPIDRKIHIPVEFRLPGSDADQPFVIVEKMPTFRKGNLDTFRKWVQGEIKYPAEAVQKNIQGRVVVSFVVEPDGSLGDIQLLQAPDKLLADEARRVIETSPAGDWSPGMQRGEKVRVKYTLPVDFRLPDGNGKLPGPTAPDGDEPFLIAETMPTFQSGDINNFRKWVQMQVRYPAEAMKNNIQGRVITSFVIERDGSISNIQVLQAPDKLLADEARRVIETSPAGAWSPGRQRGQAVRVKFTIPVDFLIQSEDGKLPERDEKPAGSLDGVVVVGYGSPGK